MSETIEWRWVDVDGKQTVLGFGDLAALFSSESLPAFTLVWRPGWSTWLAAANVPELLPALGAERAGPPTSLRPDATATTPPPPPMERYRGITNKTLVGLSRARPQPTVPPPPPPPPRRPPRALEAPAPSNRTGLPSLPPPVSFPSAPVPVRDVQPTLADDELPGRSPTLRPAGALPPPPRSYPRQPLPAFGSDDDAEELLAPDAPDAPYDDDERPTPPEPTPEAERLAFPLAPPDTPPPPPPLPAAPTPLAPAASSVPPASAPWRTHRKLVTTVTAGSLLIPGTVLLLAALLWPSKKPGAVPATTPSVAAQVVDVPPQAATPVGCSVATPARKLEDSAFASVPLLSGRDGSGRALMGFAASKEQAIGVSLDPTTLEVTRLFEQRADDAATLGVVPLVSGGEQAFAVDRAEKAFSSARTVDATPRFTLGVSLDGFGRRVGQQVTMIWPGKSEDPTITTPRVARLPAGGYAVAFRHGGQNGKVLVGYLTPDGDKATDLTAVGQDGALVGTPALAANDRRLLVAFAAKEAADAPWFVTLASADAGSLPQGGAPFTVPPGGPGGEVISPAVEGLPGGRFLLQWTEGSAGNRAVRVQVLGADLAPIGEPVTLSGREQNAGQGALWVDGERALALFLVKSASGHELWGASLTCP